MIEFILLPLPILISMGCAPLELTPTHYLLDDPLGLRHCFDRKKTLRAARHWAATACHESVHCQPNFCPSSDYARGFKDGFVDYVMLGGSGMPPLAPPKRYWKLKYRTPCGHRAVAEWFQGFQMGAMTAQEGGYRKAMVMPLLTAVPLGMPSVGACNNGALFPPHGEIIFQELGEDYGVETATPEETDPLPNPDENGQ